MEVARERRDNLMGLRDEIEKLKEEVAKKLKLKDLRYDCGWNIEHFRGCMKSLEYMADLHAGASVDACPHHRRRPVQIASSTHMKLNGRSGRSS